MVAIINCGKSIRRAFLYNENKQQEGLATCIGMENYLLDGPRSTADTALKTLLKLAESRPDVQVNAVHISLNFSPEEAFDDDRMGRIAREYMEQVGFGEQPYSIYRHHDSGHPHCHIVTTNIRLDNNRISLHDIGKRLSEPARKALEIQYGLVKAEDQKKELLALKPVQAEKVQYGKSETKRAIGNVLAHVLPGYKYTSLPELNAVLNLYNVRAERGKEDSRTYRKRGLVYRVLDADGRTVGVPIKASLFYNRPTLNYLEKRFLKNGLDRQKHRNQLKSTVDFTIKSKRPASLSALEEALKPAGVQAVFRRNPEGRVYGITYVDFKSKCVFNGSALGKGYSVKGIQERLAESQNERQVIRQPQQSMPDQQDRREAPGTESPDRPQDQHAANEVVKSCGKYLLEQLVEHEYTGQQVPYEWKRKKRRRKKKR